MKLIKRSNRFKKDLRRCIKRGNDLNELEKVVQFLVSGKSLPIYYRPHKLRGNYRGYLECHIEPDWLLIYKITSEDIYLSRTGTHADLFE